MNFLHSHRAGWHLVRPAVGRGTCRCRYLIKIHEGPAEGTQNLVCIELLHHLTYCEGTSEASRELDKKLCPRLMKFGHPLCQIVIHFFVFVKPLTEHRVVDRLTSGHDKTAIVLCYLHDEACAVAVKMVLLHPAEKVCAAHARQNKAIFYLAVSYLPWRK